MSTLLEELNKNKVIEDAVQPNKMSKFAYTEKAYNDNDAAGVDSFNFEAEQNIPSDKISVLQTNETVILKGFRAQASVVPRMLFDHFFGRASYNLNKVHDVVKGVLDAFVKFIGKANGIATLDENGRIPYSQLPESAMEFKGTWDASTNTPTLADGTGDTGDFYVVSVAGTQNLGSGEIKFLENDRVIYSEGVWSKLSAGDVRTVNSVQPVDGNITLTGDDINLSGSDTTKVTTKVTSHIDATTGVHGATSAPTANKIAIRDGSGRLQVAQPSVANDAVNKSYFDTALGRLGILIEKRVIRESGPVSIPEGTKWITYIGIGGGGGGGGGGGYVKDGGGGGAGGGGATGGAGGAGGGESGGSGGSGGAGESGLIKKVATLSIVANIGNGGSGGGGGVTGGAGGAGGNTYVTTNSVAELVIHIKNVTSNIIKGEQGETASGSPGSPGKATEIFDVSAGAGGAGGAGGVISGRDGGAGGKGALIMFFYS